MLGDLVALWQIGVEVMFAVKGGAKVYISIQRKGGLDSKINAFGVEALDSGRCWRRYRDENLDLALQIRLVGHSREVRQETPRR